MSKRTATESARTNPKNFHPTPLEAAMPLARILPPFTEYDEPCAGDGELITHLVRAGHKCITACDIAPRAVGITMADALWLTPDRLVITNPPFEWRLLQPLLNHWIGHCEAWLLLPGDMLFNKRMTPYAAHIDRILPLGRVSWMRNGQGGMDNHGWFHFARDIQNVVLPRH